MIKVATVCTGIGSPEQALRNLNIRHEISFACEIDKYARQTYLANFSPNQMFEDMTKQSWERTDIFHREDRLYSDLFIGGIPCQAFSLAGKRLGELDPRGLLFFDFYRYVKNQQPKVFIIENVKGLFSDNKGKTFQNWLQLLGRSVNTQEMMFQHPDSLGYNLHWTVLNTKDFGLPQNRERVFIVGIRRDLPNTFRFPVGYTLEKRLKDVLESEVDEKYYLSEKLIKSFLNHKERHLEKGTGFQFKPKYHDDIGNCLRANAALCPTDNFILISEATTQGYDIAYPGDSINFSNPNSKTRRGRVGKQIANTLDTACNQAVIELYAGAIRGRNPENPKSRISGLETRQMIEINNNPDVANVITTVQKDNIVLEKIHTLYEDDNDAGRIYSADGLSCTLKSQGGGGGAKTGLYALEDTEKGYLTLNGVLYRIRRLTPLECFRLQGFPDDFIKPVSDTQLYKQAGNTISVSVIENIIQILVKNIFCVITIIPFGYI